MDGVIVALGYFTGNPGDTEAISLVIGARPDDRCPTDFCDHFGGLIDEVEIYNRALSVEEIQAIYQAGGDGKIKP